MFACVAVVLMLPARQEKEHRQPKRPSRGRGSSRLTEPLSEGPHCTTILPHAPQMAVAAPLAELGGDDQEDEGEVSNAEWVFEEDCHFDLGFDSVVVGGSGDSDDLANQIWHRPLKIPNPVPGRAEPLESADATDMSQPAAGSPDSEADHAIEAFDAIFGGCVEEFDLIHADFGTLLPGGRPGDGGGTGEAHDLSPDSDVSGNRQNPDTAQNPKLKRKRANRKSSVEVLESGDPARPYQCSFVGCTYKAAQRRYIGEHMATHTGRKVCSMPSTMLHTRSLARSLCVASCSTLGWERVRCIKGLGIGTVMLVIILNQPRLLF